MPDVRNLPPLDVLVGKVCRLGLEAGSVGDVLYERKVSTLEGHSG
jgi:hypothetical protein